MKIFFVLFITLINVFAPHSIYASYTIRFIGRMDDLALEKDGEIIVSNLVANPLTLNTKDFEEPTKIAIVNMRSNKKLYFYLDNHSSEISIHTNELNIQNTNSEINTEYLEYLKTINDFNLSKLSEINQKDFILKWCLSHSNSFVCFDFIENELRRDTPDSNLIKDIIIHLNPSLHKYPTYKKYKQIYIENSPIDDAPSKPANNILATEYIKCSPSQYNSHTTFNIAGNNYKNYQAVINNVVVIDSLKQENSITRKIDEPTIVTLINLNDSTARLNRSFKSMHFYLDFGVNDITLDIENSCILSSSSKLNNELNDLLKIKSHYDSLINLAQKNNKLGFRTNNNNFDTTVTEYHKAYYEYCLTIPNSFNTLDFVSFLSDTYSQVGMKKDEVITLFNCLGNNLNNFPTYKETKKKIEEILLFNSDRSNEKINSPLWTPEK